MSQEEKGFIEHTRQLEDFTQVISQERQEELDRAAAEELRHEMRINIEENARLEAQENTDKVDMERERRAARQQVEREEME